MPFWSRQFLCCAIPLYNVGIYALLSQFFVISVAVGVLCFASPAVIAADVPTWCPYITGAFCFIVGVVQVVGLIGVVKDNTRLFKLYTHINTAAVFIVFAFMLSWIIVSATRHPAIITNCVQMFTSDEDASNSTRNICRVWTWAQLGLMGLVFLLVALSEIYFIMYTYIYAKEQANDHIKYDRVYSTAQEELRQSAMFPTLPPVSEEDETQAHFGAAPQSNLRNEMYPEYVQDPEYAHGNVPGYESVSGPIAQPQHATYYDTQSSTSRTVTGLPYDDDLKYDKYEENNHSNLGHSFQEPAAYSSEHVAAHVAPPQDTEEGPYYGYNHQAQHRY